MKRIGSTGERRTGASRGAEVRARLANLRGSRQRSILGLPEIIGLSVAGLLLLTMLFAYFYFLLPERARLRRAGEERAKLQNELRLSTEGIRREENTQASVEKILGSLQEFESRNLVSREEAGTAVIEELNTLMRRNNLRITTGVSFVQLEAVDPNAPQQQRAVTTTGAVRAIQNIFPGVGVNLTVEGTYASLRRFIRDVEADPRFIVINGVELEGVTDTGSRAAAAIAAQPGVEGAPPTATAAPPTRGTLVSLQLNMAAYFRRSNLYAPPETERER
ncbi:MAG TPA: GspMb/PilO family protein [Pyrinomonadaceae bacterium]